MKLCIISHTEHYTNKAGELVSWGATVTEINHLTKIFDEIYHIAMYYEQEPPSSSLPYTSSKVKFVKIPAMGGHHIKDKIDIIKNIPKVIKIVKNTLKKVDYFQLRCPTGIGVFLIPYLSLFVRKKGWYKYAGNWNQDNPPLGYRLQRIMLKFQNRKVTINGKWPNQPKQCLSFENPTLFKDEILKAGELLKTKNYSKKLNLCFVGRLERPKGVLRILESLILLKDKSKLGNVFFIGEGEEREYFESFAKKTGVNCEFYGGLSRNDVFQVYKKSHIFLLPSSASEGFPKVIAEAMCFGCFPIVSDVSSIKQYIKHKQNGIIINPLTIEKLSESITMLLSGSKPNLLDSIDNDKNRALLTLFTYEYYNSRIKNDILNL